MKKFLRSAIRNLTSLATECLRSGDADLMAEVQQIIIRLLEIQDRMERDEENPSLSRLPISIEGGAL